MKRRVWELDALRGICILGMVAVHFVYDMVELYALAQWKLPEAFLFVQNWGGVLFLLIAGISATLGSRSVRRGLIVIACGLVVGAVTYGMYRLDFADKYIIIYFGVLHCLGTCMLLWAPLKKLPFWALAVLGAALVWLGFYIETLPPVDTWYLVPLGLLPQNFASSDYFPLLPYFGFFLLGAALGKTVYRSKETLLPKVNENNLLLRPLRFCGRHSLWIYMLHQPVLTGVCMVIQQLQQK